MRSWTIIGLLLMVAWWRRTSFSYCSSVLGSRINDRPNSAALQHRGSKTDEVSTTHLVTEKGAFIAFLRVSTIPGAREWAAS